MDSPSDQPPTGTVPENDWRCSACGEENGPAFQVCWRCGAARVTAGGSELVSNNEPLSRNKAASAASDSSRHRPRAKSTALTVVLSFAFFNLLIGPIASSISGNPILLVVICYGSIGAQFGLHAIWCVLAPVAWKTRLTAAVFVAIALYGTFTLGVAIMLMNDDWPSIGDFSNEILTGILCIPVIALGIQAPLWFAYVWHRWRVHHITDSAARAALQAPGIRHILIATVVVALALAAVRSVAALHDVPADGVVGGLLGGSFFAMMISLVTVLPITIATLRARQVAAAIGWVLLLDIVILVVLISIFASFPGGVNGEAIFYFCVMFAAFYGALAGPLLIFRRLGYRLSWGRDSTSPSPLPQ